MKSIAILGAGNGGASMGAYLSLKGHKVKLYDKFVEVIEPIQAAGGLKLKGISLNGFATFDKISTDIKEVIENCEFIMVVTPAFAHKELAELCAEHLEDGQIIVLHPGRTGGALEFYNIVKKKNPAAKVSIAEAQTLIYACRKTGPAEATIYGIKKKVFVSAIPSKETNKVIEKLNELFSEFVPAENVIETSLLNFGAVFHPAPSLLNIARIEFKEDFEYYHQGISPCVGKVLEKIDMERIAVARAFGVKTLSTIEWLKEAYGIKNGDIYNVVQKIKVYSGIKAPKSPTARYITEDVPMSLTPISELGKLAGVATPVIDIIIRMASIMHNTDYRKKGRTLKRMGIDKFNKDTVLEYVNGG